MCKYDYAKRLKKLLDRECALTRMEVATAKASRKFINDMEQMQSSINEQKKTVITSRRRLQELRACNEKLSKFLHDETARLQEAKERVAQLKDEVQHRAAVEVNRRRLVLEQMNKLRFIKDATKTYINVNALPQAIQGVAICETDRASRFVPFRLDPAQCTQDQVQNHIWHETQRSHTGALDKVWAQLFFGDFHTAVMQGDLRLRNNENCDMHDCVVVE